MKKKFTIISALTMTLIILMIALVGCNTSCNKQTVESASEESIETTLIDGSAVAIIETEINGSKVTETSIFSTNTSTSTSDSSQDSDKDTSESTKGNEDSGSTQSTTTQTTTESTQGNTKATNTPKPTNTPVPTTNQKNTPTPTKAPTNKPEPTATPTPEPTATPTPEPTEAPVETTPSTGYAIIKVKVTSTVYDNDETTDTHNEVDYFEVEASTSNYHSNNASDYSYNGKTIGNKVSSKYGENLVGYSAKAVEVVSFTN